MTNNEIRETLALLTHRAQELEDAYIENEGEVNEFTQQMEAEIDSLKGLLETEGIDSLGRWLKCKEDYKETLKAEKAKLEREIKAADNTINYIKGTVRLLLDRVGEKAAKGQLYRFSAYDSAKTTADTTLIAERWQKKAEEAITNAGIPAYVTVKLGASASRVLPGSELPDVFSVESSQTVKFFKPTKAAAEG